jgi:hypothetical protein
MLHNGENLALQEIMIFVIEKINLKDPTCGISFPYST